MYTSTSLIYALWTPGPTFSTLASWTVGTTGSQINQGQWYVIAVTKSGNIWTPYVNGVQLGTGTTTSVTSIGVINNYINFGAAFQASAGTGNYLYYAKNTFAGTKMYNRALSASEIAQNFNAHRGRYGI